MKIEIVITTIAIMTMSLLIHGGTFGKQCEIFEDGSNSCNKKINEDQWDCNTMGNKICGNDNKPQSQNFEDFKEDLNIIEANERTNHPIEIYEDQMIVCNMWKVCQEIDTDDYMSQESMDKLWNNFDKELDTFDMKDALNW